MPFRHTHPTAVISPLRQSPHQEVQLEQQHTRGKWRCWCQRRDRGVRAGSPELLPWTRRGNELMSNKAARGRRAQGTEVRPAKAVPEEELPSDNRRQGRCSPGKAGRAGTPLGEGRVCPHQWGAEQKSLNLGSLELLLPYGSLCRKKDRQRLQKASFQWYYLHQLFFSFSPGDRSTIPVLIKCL